MTTCMRPEMTKPVCGAWQLSVPAIGLTSFDHFQPLRNTALPIVAPAMWAFGYPGVVAWLGVLAALGTGLVWWMSYRATGDARAGNSFLFTLAFTNLGR